MPLSTGEKLGIGAACVFFLILVGFCLWALFSASSSTATTAPVTTQAAAIQTATQAAAQSMTSTLITASPTPTAAPLSAVQYQNADYPGNDITSIDLTSQPTITLQGIITQYPACVGVVISTGTSGTPTLWVKSAFGTPNSSTARTTIAWSAISNPPNYATVKNMTPSDLAQNFAQQANTCNRSACEAVIDSYIGKGWAYLSSNFGECVGCPIVQYPNKLP